MDAGSIMAAPDRVVLGRQRGWAAAALLTAATCFEVVLFLLYVEDPITLAFPVAVFALYVPVALVTTKEPGGPSAVAWFVLAIAYAFFAFVTQPPNLGWLVFGVPRAVAAMLLLRAVSENGRRLAWQRSMIVGLPLVVGLTTFALWWWGALWRWG
jgi:hypothetical protein